MESFGRIAILASTRGTDLQAIIDAIKAGTLHAELACVVSDKQNCYALERAKEQGFTTYFVDPKGKSREDFDKEVAQILKKEHVDLIVLVGFMRILSSNFVREFHRKIINIHPALLPKFGGKSFFGQSVHEAVLQAGEQETGMTIHYVEEGVDTGEIILQKKCPVYPDDTSDALKERVQALEKEWYPKVIDKLLRGASKIPS